MTTMLPTHHPVSRTSDEDRKVVLVTGGGSGIGLALARSFAALGHDVVVCGRDAERLSAATSSTARLRPIRCDVTDAADVADLLAEVDRRFGHLDVLVNNAGMQRNYSLAQEDSVRQRVEDEIALNLTALVTLTHEALPLLRRGTDAVIVNVGSGTGLVPKPDGLVYSATKAAVHSFTTGLRWELERDGIRVVELVPPVVDTDMTAGRDEAKATPEEVAEALHHGLRGGRSEVLVGRMRALPWLVRFLPRVAASVMRRS
jgi:uncharacterized oxidoreductase